MPATDSLLRQWQMLQLVPRAPAGVSYRDLHQALKDKGYEITTRSIMRDLEDFQTIFNLTADKSARPHLWSWSAQALPLDAPRMSQSEALTLLMSQDYLQALLPASTLAHMRHYFLLARQRLHKADFSSHQTLPPELHWRSKVRVLPSSQPLIAPEVSADALAQVQEALLQGRQCEIKYQKRDAAGFDEYPVHPLGLVQRGTLLYLVCSIKHYSDIKLLALHRVQSAKKLPALVQTPSGFDLDAYIAGGALGWQSSSVRLHLEAVFTEKAGAHLRETPLCSNQTVQELGNGLLKVSAELPWTQQLEWWLLGFGADVEVLAPESLRLSMAKTAGAMVAKYGAGV